MATLPPLSNACGNDVVEAFFWLSEDSVVEVATQVAEWTSLYPDAPCSVIGRSRLAAYCPPGARFCAVEDVLYGHIHPQAVAFDEDFAVCRTVLGSRPGRARSGVFIRPEVHLAGPLADLAERLATSQAVVCFEQRSVGATTRFRYAESTMSRGQFNDDVVAVVFESDVAQIVYDTLTGSVASTIGRPLWSVAIEVLIALHQEPSPVVDSSPSTLTNWANYCRAKQGDDVDFGQVCVRTADLIEYVESIERSTKRIVDHDDFYVMHRVHSVGPLEAFLASRKACRSTVHPVAKRSVLHDRYVSGIGGLRRNIDPFGKRFPDPSGADFLGWLAERSTTGVTRATEITVAAHAITAPGVGDATTDPARLLRWVARNGLATVGFDPQEPGKMPPVQNAEVLDDAEPFFTLAEGKPDTQELIDENASDDAGPDVATPEDRPVGFFSARLQPRRTAVTPHLQAIGVHARHVTFHLSPHPVRGVARRLRTRAPHRNLRVAGTFGSRPLQGLNVIGPYRNLSGLSVAMKASLAALDSLGLPFDVWDTSDFLPTKTLPPDRALRYQAPGDVNLLHLNINEILPKMALDLRYVIGGRYNVAYWFWETLTMPTEYERACALLNEGWCATRFIAEIMARRGVPSEVVGLPYQLPTADEVRLDDLMQQGGVYKVVYAFDCYSSIQRKNPMGLVEAFYRAFGKRTDVRLILKAGNLVKFPRFRAHLGSLAEQRGNITVYEESMDRASLNGLLFGADLYVSLHRSEGVGLTLLEAMALGTPCVATDYSGNLDFMDNTNSVLIPGSIESTSEQHGPYPPGTIWCAPDLDLAADVLRSAASSAPPAEQIFRAKESASAFCDPSRYIRSVSNGFTRLGIGL